MVIAEETIGIETGVAFGNQILILISAPLLERVPAENNGGTKPVTPLAVYEELEAIINALRKGRTPVEFEIKLEIATFETVRQIFTSGSRPLILHFIGHGTLADQKVALVLEDEAGLARPLDVDSLRRMLQPLRGAPCRLALLNACHSQGLADALLDAGVRHVVAVKANDTILDTAARCFSEHFYPALLSGHKVIDAFYNSRDAVIDDEALARIFDDRTYRPVNWDEALKFLLLPENSSEHQMHLDYEPVLGTLIKPKWEHTNISPVSPDPFIGRTFDLYTIARIMRDTKLPRCLVLKGMGGMGKTALALASARWHHERHRWTDGTWLIEFRNVNTAAQACDRIAAVFGLRRGYASLASALSEKHILLILDDLDMLVNGDPDGTAEFLRVLLGCRQVRLLVTGRRDLPGKVVHQVYTIKRMEPYDALVAFKKYAPPVEEWGVSDTQRADLHALMNFLDGYPFPIRLAATYMKQTRCSLHRLREQLEANPRNTLRFVGEKEDRDTSLNATLNLSYYALPPGARDVLPLLALFPAGLTENAARIILDDASVPALETLLRFSMAEETERDPLRRFALPEPARSFADQFRPPNAMEHHGPRGLAFYYEFVQEALDLLSGSNYEHGRWLLTIEQPNIKSFLDWGCDNEQTKDGISVSARLAFLVVSFWELTGSAQYQSSKITLDRALLAAQRNKDLKAEADIHKSIGDVHYASQKAFPALASYTKASELYQMLSERLSEARVQNLAGDMWHSLRHLDKAATNYETGLHLYEAEAKTYEGQEEVLKRAAKNLRRERTGKHLDEQIERYVKETQQYRKSLWKSIDAYTKALGSYRLLKHTPDSNETRETIDSLHRTRKTMDERFDGYIRILASMQAAINPENSSAE